jgi:hypothetical protein
VDLRIMRILRDEAIPVVPGDTAAATWALKAFALDSVDGKERPSLPAARR